MMKIGELEIDLQELVEFVIEAKKNTYAGGDEEKRLPDGSKLLVFQEGNFYYENNYDGGRELVKWQRENGQRIWQMSYSGGMLPEFWGDKRLSHLTFEFLKNALRKIDPKLPFRGLDKYKNVNFIYEVWIEGDFQRFSGEEQIISKKLERIIFSQDFIGGLVPK